MIFSQSRHYLDERFDLDLNFQPPPRRLFHHLAVAELKHQSSSKAVRFRRVRFRCPQGLGLGFGREGLKYGVSGIDYPLSCNGDNGRVG